MTDTQTAAGAPAPEAAGTPPQRRVLFLCTGNAARSQMAEGWLRHYAGDAFHVESAGTEARPEVHPLAVRVMADAGIDLASQYPKSLTPARPAAAVRRRAR
jgi:protein-tyrosine-phosphatase